MPDAEGFPRIGRDFGGCSGIFGGFRQTDSHRGAVPPGFDRHRGDRDGREVPGRHPALLIGVQATRTPCDGISASRQSRIYPDRPPFWSSDDSPRTHCSGTQSATGPRPPSGTAESQPGERIARCEAADTSSSEFLEPSLDKSGLPDDTGSPSLYGKGPLRMKKAAAPNGAAANSSVCNPTGRASVACRCFRRPLLRAEAAENEFSVDGSSKSTCTRADSPASCNFKILRVGARPVETPFVVRLHRVLHLIRQGGVEIGRRRCLRVADECSVLADSCSVQCDREIVSLIGSPVLVLLIPLLEVVYRSLHSYNRFLF